MADNYYVYGLIDPDDLPSLEGTTLEERLGSVFYVGKGIGFRSEQHVKDAQWVLENRPDEAHVVGAKLSRIIEVLKSGRRIEAVKLMAGFDDEQDAYRAEAFAIEAVNALRSALGKDRLTNAVKGHGVATESFENFANRIKTEVLPIAFDSEDLSILVKGNRLDLWASENTFQPCPQTEFAQAFGEAAEKINVSIAEGEATCRVGWDVQTPWTDEQARERARRYWPIAKDKVARWINDPESAPKHLLLAIEEDGNSVVRYAWEIDQAGSWEYYPDDKRWGVPLGKAVQHPYLNKVLVDENTGRQVLASYSAGIRIDRF